MTAACLFWSSVVMVVYAYAGYPMLASMLARWRGRTPLHGDALTRITVIIAAYNEQARIASRVRDVLAQDYPADRLHVIVVSDGSDDDTASAAAIDDTRVIVIRLGQNAGKAVALNHAMRHVQTELVAFADARQRYAPGALKAMVAAFSDPQVGAVSGELVIEDGGHGSEGVGLYWRMEKQLRADEARLGWLHGVSGAIHAMRRDLFRPIPAGTILDDMWLPLQVLLSGHRVWMARDAVAFDYGNADLRGEFERKLRTLAGNWQLIARLPVLLNPLRNPVFFAWVSHKFMRLLAPWALLGALLSSALAHGMFYRLAFGAQMLAYAWAILGLRSPRLAVKVPLMPAAGAFLMLNLAALLSLPASLAWHPSRLWKKH